jgi:hypothetical protein
MVELKPESVGIVAAANKTEVIVREVCHGQIYNI